MPLPNVAAWSSCPAARNSEGEAAAEFVESLAHPFHDMEGIEADQGLRCLSRTTSWIQPTPSAETCVSSFDLSIRAGRRMR